MAKANNCPDCGTGIGMPHRSECDVELCSICGGQRICCDCEGHDPMASAWTGEWLNDKKPDVIITDDPKFGQGRKKLLSWPEFAAELLPKLQEEHPELRQVTLDQFIRHSPFRFEIVE